MITSIVAGRGNKRVVWDRERNYQQSRWLADQIIGALGLTRESGKIVRKPYRGRKPRFSRDQPG